MSEQRTEVVHVAKESGESRKTFELLGGCVYLFWRPKKLHMSKQKSCLQCHMEDFPTASELDHSR